jgi:hypothetical protein
MVATEVNLGATRWKEFAASAGTIASHNARGHANRRSALKHVGQSAALQGVQCVVRVSIPNFAEWSAENPTAESCVRKRQRVENMGAQNARQSARSQYAKLLARRALETSNRAAMFAVSQRASGTANILSFVPNQSVT